MSRRSGWEIGALVLALALGFSGSSRCHGADAAGGDHAAAAEADHGDAAHGDGHAPVNTDPLEWKSDLAIWNGVVFLVLLAVLSKFAWGPIAAGLDKREHNIKHLISEAERQNAEAKQLLASYERKLSEADGKVREMIEEARRDAEHTQQQIVAKANAEALATRDRSLRDIETATAAALKEIADRGADLAVDLAGKIVQAQLKPADHARLIQDALAAFPRSVASKN